MVSVADHRLVAAGVEQRVHRSRIRRLDAEQPGGESVLVHGLGCGGHRVVRGDDFAGEVVARNDAVPSAPETVNQDAYAAWLFRIRPADPAAMDALLDTRGYQAVIGD